MRDVKITFTVFRNNDKNNISNNKSRKKNYINKSFSLLFGGGEIIKFRLFRFFFKTFIIVIIIE